MTSTVGLLSNNEFDYHLYPKSVSGCDLVTWLVNEGYAVSREGASVLGCNLCRFGYMEGLDHREFVDSVSLYQLRNTGLDLTED